MAVEWIKNRRERIVAAVQARHGRSAAAEAVDEDKGIDSNAHEIAAVDTMPKAEDEEDVLAAAVNPEKDIEEQWLNVGRRGEQIGRAQPTPFEDVAPRRERPVVRAPPAGKSRCVKRIEDIEKRRRERRNSAKHLMQLKENGDTSQHELVRLVERSRASCGVRDEDASGAGKENASSDESNAAECAAHGNACAIGEAKRVVVPQPFQALGKVSVFVRKRPLNAKEYAADAVDCVTVGRDTKSGACGVVVMHEPKVRVDLRREVELHRFQFDGAFSAGQDTMHVYASCVSPVVRSALSALSVASAKHTRKDDIGPPLAAVDANGRQSGGTVFAYGQTGSGKTYTMQRILTHAVDEVFTLIDASDTGVTVKVSCYEIYAGKVFDLLAHTTNNNNNRFNVNANNNLPVREDAQGNVMVVGLSHHKCGDANAVLQLARRAEAMRATGATAANDLSSRSHYIFQLEVHTGGAVENSMRCKLRLVDLAGSERGADTNCADRRTRQEGAEINKSLLALKECIRALDSEAGASAANEGSPGVADDTHVPFRGCRLTHLLRDAFVSHSRSCSTRLAVLACIAPGSDSVEHSLNTLRYAAHVKEFGKEKNAFEANLIPSSSEPPSAPVHVPPKALVPPTTQSTAVTLADAPISTVVDIADLKDKKCAPCRGKATVALVREEAEKLCLRLGGEWRIDKNGKGQAALKLDITVKNFTKGLELLSRIGSVAEQEGHHPDLHLESWNKVGIVINTHSIGGLTENDFILAAKISHLDISDLTKRG